MPIMSGLIRYWAADCSAIGAMIATPAALRAPTPHNRVVSANMIQGINPTLPLTSRRPQSMSRSMVPFFWAMANRRVIPARRMNKLAGKPSKISSALRPPRRVPTRKAATKPMTPRLIGQTVATTNITTSTIIEKSSGLTGYLLSHLRQYRVEQLPDVTGPVGDERASSHEGGHLILDAPFSGSNDRSRVAHPGPPGRGPSPQRGNQGFGKGSSL